MKRIFVTVGTHEQQFDRLIKAVDKYTKQSDADVLMQIGYSTYIPKYCKWKRFLKFNEMEDNMRKADVVITHGGPSTFLQALSLGKVPIVVPRRAEFNEHINNHQVDFLKYLSDRLDQIVPVFDIKYLPDAIVRVECLMRDDEKKFETHNKVFCDELRRIIERL